MTLKEDAVITAHAKCVNLYTVLLSKVSHIFNYKTSITLRVLLCRRHKVRLKNRCKCTKKLERQGGFGEFFLLLRHKHKILHNDNNNAKL